MRSNPESSVVPHQMHLNRSNPQNPDHPQEKEKTRTRTRLSTTKPRTRKKEVRAQISAELARRGKGRKGRSETHEKAMIGSRKRGRARGLTSDRTSRRITRPSPRREFRGRGRRGKGFRGRWGGRQGGGIGSRSGVAEEERRERWDFY